MDISTPFLPVAHRGARWFVGISRKYSLPELVCFACFIEPPPSYEEVFLKLHEYPHSSFYHEAVNYFETRLWSMDYVMMTWYLLPEVVDYQSSPFALYINIVAPLWKRHLISEQINYPTSREQEICVIKRKSLLQRWLIPQSTRNLLNEWGGGGGLRSDQLID